MAEGKGVEPFIPDGKPWLSKPAQYRSASLPRNGAGGGSRTHRTQGLNLLAMPIRLRPHDDEYCVRPTRIRTGNRYSHGSGTRMNAPRLPVSPEAERNRGGEGRDRPFGVYRMGHRFTGGCRRLWAYLSKSGRNGGGRTHTGQALNLFPLPSWDTFRWWAMRDSNLHYTAFKTVVSACWTNGPYSVVLAEECGVEPQRPKSSVFGTGGLASYAQLLRARSITQAQ